MSEEQAVDKTEGDYKTIGVNVSEHNIINYKHMLGIVVREDYIEEADDGDAIIFWLNDQQKLTTYDIEGSCARINIGSGYVLFCFGWLDQLNYLMYEPAFYWMVVEVVQDLQILESGDGFVELVKTQRLSPNYTVWDYPSFI
jgi:hypothetical protein